jgi:hypothetical protein
VNHFTAFGQFNTLAAGEANVTNRVFVIGNGASDATRSNLFSISSNGDVNTMAGGSYYTGGADFNEYFEHESNVRLPVGASVVITEEGKIRRARKGEEPHGVHSVRGGFVGNAAEEEWHSKWMYSEQQGKRVLNPLFDSTRRYIPRSQRAEWHTIGLVGQVEVLKSEVVSTRWIAMPKRLASTEKHMWYLIR